MLRADRRSARVAIAVLLLWAWPSRPRAAETETAIFAGGCFWSMQHVFDGLPGVTSTSAGYAGGTAAHPSYEQVEAGITGHAESVRVQFDPAKISYPQLLDTYWRNVDPTTAAGQFCDFGSQYRPIIFVSSDAQREAAEQSKRALEATHRFKRVLVQIVPAAVFWPAEAYHQHFATTHAAAYEQYRVGCGRDKRLRELWERR